MNERHARRLTCGLTCLLLACLAIAGGSMHWRLVGKAQAQLHQTQSQLASRRQMIERSTADARLQKLESQLRDLDQIIPAQNQATRVMEQFTTTLARMSLSQRSVISGRPVQLRGLTQVPIHVRFEGSFQSVFDLLGQFESSQPAVRLEQLVLKRDLMAAEEKLTVDATFATFHGQQGDGLVAALMGAQP